MMNEKKSNNNLSDWIDILQKTGEDRPQIHYHNNVECLKCNTLEVTMIRTGCLIFCEKCFKEEFKTDKPITDERDTYQKWLKIYNKKYN
jgi:hypothetical protein